MRGGPAKGIFQRTILEWYHQHKRALPWRAAANPYHIWLSEIILQQTRVAQGLPYFEKFVQRFPTVKTLAAASEQEVLRLWQGLGYYSRARNLHRCAQQVVAQHNGKFPASYEALLQLPGVGPYTAAAIASMAFGLPTAVVDGNVFRVLARVFGIDTDIAGNEGKKQFTTLANELLPHDQPGDYNQALMEFGALQCTPQNPDCASCPLRARCVAFATQRVSILPVKEKKIKVRVRHFNYFVLTRGKDVAMQPRSGADIWKGLYDFYLVETAKEVNAEKILETDKHLAALAARLRPQTAVQVRHQLTHQQLYIRFVECEVGEATLPLGLQWYTHRQCQRLPKPIVITRYLEARN